MSDSSSAERGSRPGMSDSSSAERGSRPGMSDSSSAERTPDARAVPWRSPKWGMLAFLSLIALMLPWALTQFGGGNFLLHMFIMFFLWSVLAQAWNLVLGVSGIYSFAQLALFAVGGWTTGVLALHYGVNPWLSLIAAPIAATIAAIIIGLPSLRLRGVYVVLLTLAFHELLRNYVTNGPRIISGGGYGLIGVPRLPFGGLTTNRLVMSYYVGLVLFIVGTWAIWWIFHSPIGVAFSALRDSEGYAVSRGINQFRIKLFLFAFSAFFSGLAGGVMTHYLGSISPSIFAFSVLINVLAMIVIGGWGSFGGPILGTALLLGLQEGLRDLADYRTLGLGIALAFMAVVAPRGLWPLLRDWVARMLEEPAPSPPGEGDLATVGVGEEGVSGAVEPSGSPTTSPGGT
jgi:branched-chain amino acid transport system permease protein